VGTKLVPPFEALSESWYEAQSSKLEETRGSLSITIVYFFN